MIIVQSKQKLVNTFCKTKIQYLYSVVSHFIPITTSLYQLQFLVEMLNFLIFSFHQNAYNYTIWYC